MQCPSCGNVLEATDHFCPICGTKVNVNAQNVPVTPSAPNVQNAQYAPGAPNGQNAQYAPGVPNGQNAQYMPGAQNVPAQPPMYAYGMQNVGQPFYPGSGTFPNQQPLTRKMFFSTYASPKVRNGIRSSAILCYISAALTALTGILLMGNFFTLLDSALLILFGVLLHVKQSRVAAILLLAYSCFNMIVTLVNTGTPGGWLLVIAGIGAVYAAFSFDKEYKAYHGQ